MAWKLREFHHAFEKSWKFIKPTKHRFMSMGHFFKYYVDYQSLLILESPTAQGRSWR